MFLDHCVEQLHQATRLAGVAKEAVGSRGTSVESSGEGGERSEAPRQGRTHTSQQREDAKMLCTAKDVENTGAIQDGDSCKDSTSVMLAVQQLMKAFFPVSFHPSACLTARTCPYCSFAQPPLSLWQSPVQGMALHQSCKWNGACSSSR